MRVPNGVAIINSEFCRKTFTAKFMSQTRSYDLAVVGEATIGGSAIGVAFSASPGYRLIQKRLAQSDSFLVETTSKCEVYTALLLP
jgi:hypothetical protein